MPTDASRPSRPSRGGAFGGGAAGVGSATITPTRPGDPCPCGSSRGYAACCGRYHAGAPAPHAEALMRSRYAAFAVGDAPYLLRTWHPRTRPEEVRLDAGHRWTGLEVVDTLAGGPTDETGEVTYVPVGLSASQRPPPPPQPGPGDGVPDCR